MFKIRRTFIEWAFLLVLFMWCNCNAPAQLDVEALGDVPGDHTSCFNHGCNKELATNRDKVRCGCL